MALLGLAKLLESEHIDRTKIFELLPQIVSLTPGVIENKVVGRLDRGDKVAKRHI